MASWAERRFETLGHPVDNRQQAYAFERAIHYVDADVGSAQADIFKDGSLHDLLPSNQENLTSEFSQLPQSEVDSVKQHLARGGLAQACQEIEQSAAT
jgi:hypothetical protein